MVGDMVWYYRRLLRGRRGDEQSGPWAALVTEEHGEDELSLTVFIPGDHRSETVRCLSWNGEGDKPREWWARRGTESHKLLEAAQPDEPTPVPVPEA